MTVAGCPLGAISSQLVSLDLLFPAAPSENKLLFAMRPLSHKQALARSVGTAPAEPTSSSTAKALCIYSSPAAMSLGRYIRASSARTLASRGNPRCLVAARHFAKSHGGANPLVRGTAPFGKTSADQYDIRHIAQYIAMYRKARRIS